MSDSRYRTAGTTKTTQNRIEPRCGSMKFQTGIRTASELHRTAVLFGTGTTETAGIVKTAGTTIEKKLESPMVTVFKPETSRS